MLVFLKLAHRRCGDTVLPPSAHACNNALLVLTLLLPLVKKVNLLRMLFALQLPKAVLTLIISLSPPYLPVGP